MTRFERAYIDLYNDRITLEQFPQAAGIQDPEEALRQLRKYREQVIDGEIKDPRDKYHKWRRNHVIQYRLFRNR